MIKDVATSAKSLLSRIPVEEAVDTVAVMVAAPGAARDVHRATGVRRIVLDLLPKFSRKLGAMLSAGMPIVTCLKALEKQERNPNFTDVISGVRCAIEDGCSLSESLRKYPELFDNLYVNMVRGGEKGGLLPETIGRLADLLESSGKLRKKVKSALTYPVVVLCIAVLISAGMLMFVLPVFATLYEEVEKELPAPTMFLIDAGSFLRNSWHIVVMAVMLFSLLLRRWCETAGGRYVFDCIALKLPVLGELNKMVAAARFARTFGQLIRSGVTITSNLEISAGAAGNSVIGNAILESRRIVEEGAPLSSGLRDNSLFPEMLVEMLQAGEKAGQVDEMMECTADFYEDEVDTMLNSLTSLLEPLLMVVLGVLIGGIVICMFLPIFNMPTILN